MHSNDCEDRNDTHNNYNNGNRSNSNEEINKGNDYIDFYYHLYYLCSPIPTRRERIQVVFCNKPQRDVETADFFYKMIFLYGKLDVHIDPRSRLKKR